MADRFYTTQPWISLRERVLERDADRCLLARFVGGRCAGPLAVHHVIPRSERPDLALDESNLVTTCHKHHPTLEAFRVFLRQRNRRLPPCPHKHPYLEGQLAQLELVA